jgi:hypothetical protein
MKSKALGSDSLHRRGGTVPVKYGSLINIVLVFNRTGSHYSVELCHPQKLSIADLRLIGEFTNLTFSDRPQFQLRSIFFYDVTAENSPFAIIVERVHPKRP